MEKRILVVANMYPSEKFPYYGTFVRNFCNQLEELKIKYALSVLTKKEGKISKALHYTWFYLKTFLKCVFGRYDAVYVHYPSFSSPPVLAAKKLRKFDLYVNCHGSDVISLKGSHKNMEKYTEKSIEKSKKVIVPSAYFKETVQNKYHKNGEEIYVYPSGGVNLKKFHPYSKSEIEKKKKENGLDVSKMYIGYISRLNIEKGWDTFLAAAKIVKDNGYDCEFVMVGSGKDEKLVKETIEKSGLQNVIHRFPQQPQDQLPDYYNIIDVFCFPTAAAESLGLVAIEAMACGCPVIASDYAAPGTYVIERKNGMKFPKGKAQDLANCMMKYIHLSEEKKEELVKGALSTAEMYGEKNAINILKDILS